MRCGTSWAVLLSTVLAACAHPGNTIRTIEPSELQPRSSFDMAAALAWKRPAAVGFELEGVQVKGDRARVTGWLSNRSAEPQVVVIFPVGPLGLTVEPAPGRATRVPPRPGEPPLPMCVPPPPEFFTLPAHSQVRLESELDLSQWSWDSRTPREVEWSYQFWDEPKPRGVLRLP